MCSKRETRVRRAAGSSATIRFPAHREASTTLPVKHDRAEGQFHRWRCQSGAVPLAPFGLVPGPCRLTRSSDFTDCIVDDEASCLSVFEFAEHRPLARSPNAARRAGTVSEFLRRLCRSRQRDASVPELRPALTARNAPRGPHGRATVRARTRVSRARCARRSPVGEIQPHERPQAAADSTPPRLTGRCASDAGTLQNG